MPKLEDWVLEQKEIKVLMRDVLLVRYGEVFLKGANRPHFLKVLTDNVKRVVKPLGGHVWLSDSRVYVSDFDDLQACIDRVSKVFGVYSVSPAVEMEKDLDVIAEQCVKMEVDYITDPVSEDGVATAIDKLFG